MSTIVIGAGLAGLAAAHKLQDSGEEVIVLEAQPHVGGRTRTVRGRFRHDQPADLGASFIDLGQDLILQVCAELGVTLTPRMELFPRDPDGRATGASPLRNAVVLDGRLLDPAERDRIADEVRAALDAAPPLPTETLPAWAARAGLSPVARRVFLAQTGTNPVEEPWATQMAHVHPLHIGMACWMIADGSDSLAHALAHDLDVRLEHPVRLVRRDGRRMTVESDHGSFTADDVIVATPVTPTLRIGFDPVLPEWKVNALLATPMTQGGKVVGQYTQGREIKERLGLAAMSNGPIGVIWARPVGPQDTVVILGLVPDRADGVLRDEERALEALDDMVRTVTGVTPRRLAGIVQDWTREQYAGGVVSSLDGDYPRRPALLGQAVGPVHFAGEHTAELWETSMDGALRSGFRVADEVLQRRRARVGRLSRTR
ncbi:NAD(P)/FAD-dependent oxidoreductase [Streptomyces noursei]|uniref:flavin monoamine oxidase family protein n=1 Tax=Streptomyces noursei TaxID=1971 RepID=UPI00332F54FD